MKYACYFFMTAVKKIYVQSQKYAQNTLEIMSKSAQGCSNVYWVPNECLVVGFGVYKVYMSAAIKFSLLVFYNNIMFNHVQP